MNNGLDWSLGPRFAVALAIGFLLGLERESGRREHPKFFFGGVRTFPIVSVYGFACAWLTRNGAALVLPIGLLSIVVLAAISYVEKIKAGRLGATTEAAALATFVMGAMALMADVRIPIAMAVINTLLLSEKSALESYVERLDRSEFLATLKFLLVTVVIYPFLPRMEYTAYRLNPARIWQIVVMVSAIGFVGYILTRKLGPRAGLPLSGLMGGVASSTAVSVAAGRIAGANAAHAKPALQASLLAGSIMYIRLLVLIAIFGGGFVFDLDRRLLLLALTGFLLALTVRTRDGNVEAGTTAMPMMQNPVEIRIALLFAALFVGLRIATNLARDHFGHMGVLGLGTLAGLVDVDPFVLSLVQNPPAMRRAIQAVLLAVMVNTLAKGCYFAVLSRVNRWRTLWRYGLWAAAHVPLMWW
jgi:uncharacterized membrane protein (DUF4010 family)